MRATTASAVPCRDNFEMADKADSTFGNDDDGDDLIRESQCTTTGQATSDAAATIDPVSPPAFGYLFEGEYRDARWMKDSFGCRILVP